MSPKVRSRRKLHNAFAAALCIGIVACGKRPDPGAEREPAPADAQAAIEGVALVPAQTQPVVETAPEPEWESERFAETAKAALKRWLHGERGGHLVSEDFESAPLRPTNLSKEPLGDEILVLRGEGAGRAQGGDLSAAYPEGAGPEKELIKIFSVEITGGQASTKVRYEASGVAREGGRVQQIATWLCEWDASDLGAPRLRAIRTEDYEEVICRDAEPWFVDRSVEVLGANASWAAQLRHGLDHWLQRIELFHGAFLGQRCGIAVGDIDGDGLDDLYVPQPSGLPNRLFLHRPDGTASDVSASSGADWLDFTSSALIVDLDNDGDGDLALATNSGVIVLENIGGTRFTRRAVLKGEDNDVESLTAIDFDGDSDLDLHICYDYAAVGARPAEVRGSGVLHDSNDGGANLLFASKMADGSPWLFTDVTRESGLDANNRRHSIASSWEDYDNDGDPDLYVANDYGQNCLYQNDGGTFTEIAAAAGVLDTGPGMSASWSDYDRDGDMDLYVGNMFSSAGGRIFDQGGFRPWLPEDERDLYRRFVKGNSMFENTGDGQFVEVGAERGVEIARWAWSSVFGDLNNDGWDDIVVANGYVTAPDTGDL